MTPEIDIKIVMTRTEQNKFNAKMIAQRKEQNTLSLDDLTILRNFYQWLTNSSIFNDTSSVTMLAKKRGVYFHRLVLVPKRQPGIQTDLHSSDLPEEAQKLVKENSVKKILFHARTENQPIMLWKCIAITMT